MINKKMNYKKRFQQIKLYNNNNNYYYYYKIIINKAYKIIINKAYKMKIYFNLALK
jgi:hypothetical protein